MSKELFGQPYDKNDPYWIVKSYFDRMYGSGLFIKAIGYMAEKNSFHLDGAYCSFPDMDSCFEEEHFEGVEFSYGYPPDDSDTIIVSESICYKYLAKACDKYLKYHPEDDLKVNSILGRSFLKNG
ncbi:ribonuclease toxin immunity protein CdiI [Enterobacter chuandaensis]|uniref:ribonuclease toxin immunity protein CdiI n=1 Tax=Enterobacter chuandaensis TaxID=2497875 RepID=UPI000E773144|nr:ribonuclease toxin immunity protein CdiI [Enterobacter chuandaensis]RJL00094.1 hypothetical protein D5066_18130 [Enterobacter chuandaensis]